ncbi:MAG: hypothetical protein AAB214_03850 [Fibrobacterota bacterium]
MIRSALLTLALAASGLQAATPSTMLFQGNMTVDGKASSETTPLIVALYDNATAGAKVWEESFSDAKFTNGYFAVMLGSSKALPTFDKPLFVQLTAGGKSAATRIPLTTAPYSQRASVADSATKADVARTAKGVDTSIVSLNQNASGFSTVQSVAGTKSSSLLLNPTTGTVELQVMTAGNGNVLKLSSDGIGLNEGGIKLPINSTAANGVRCTVENKMVLGSISSTAGPVPAMFVCFAHPTTPGTFVWVKI